MFQDIRERSCACRLDLQDIRLVTKLGGTVDDSEMVEGMVFDQKAAKARIVGSSGAVCFLRF